MMILIPVTVLLIIAVIAYSREMKKLPKKIDRFSERAALSLDEIYSQYYAATEIDKSRFRELWTNIAEILKIDERRLRPTDQFKLELRPIDGSLAEDELVDLDYYVRRECKKKRIHFPEQQLKTLDDIVRLLLILK